MDYVKETMVIHAKLSELTLTRTKDQDLDLLVWKLNETVALAQKWTRKLAKEKEDDRQS